MEIKKKVQVDVDEIDAKKTEMLKVIGEIVKSIDEVEDKIKETVEFYDTDTGDYFREKSLELLDNEKQKIDLDLIPFINSLEKVSNLYRGMIEDIRKDVNG